MFRYNNGIKAEGVVTGEGNCALEIKNIAVLNMRVCGKLSRQKFFTGHYNHPILGAAFLAIYIPLMKMLFLPWKEEG